MTKSVTVPLLAENSDFSAAAKVLIDEYVWEGDYKPKAKAQIYRTDSAFYIRMEAEERSDCLRITEKGITENACEDSCLEFFIMPEPQNDKRYFNFEFTLGGAIYLGVGKDRYDNVLLEGTDLSQFDICTEMVNEKGVAKWSVKAKIPYEFLSKTLGIKLDFSVGAKLKTNFYKCGDKCGIAHYGSWNKMISEKPDFHLPDCFGDMILG